VRKETAINIEVYDQDPGKDDFIGRLKLSSARLSLFHFLLLIGKYIVNC